MLRTHTCGELTRSHEKQIVTLCGWVHRRRDHGKLIFIDIRDRYGITQVVFVPGVSKEAHDTAQKLGPEYVIKVTGEVVARSERNINKDIPAKTDIVSPCKKAIHIGKPSSISAIITVPENINGKTTSPPPRIPVFSFSCFVCLFSFNVFRALIVFFVSINFSFVLFVCSVFSFEV